VFRTLNLEPLNEYYDPNNGQNAPEVRRQMSDDRRPTVALRAMAGRQKVKKVISYWPE